MNLEFTPEEQAFRDEVRAFIAENYPKHLGDVGLREDLSREDFLAWHKILGEKGWSVPAWPVEYGGTGWTPTQRYIWNEENARVNAERRSVVVSGLFRTRCRIGPRLAQDHCGT